MNHRLSLREDKSLYYLFVIDSHCHLADSRFRSDLPIIIERATKTGVDRMICIADTFEEGEECLKIATKFESVFCTIGVHPHEAKRWQDGDEQRLRLFATSSPRVRAIGEIGLDYHYDLSPREVQRKVFSTQLGIAKELNLSAVVHTRESLPDLLSIINEVRPQKLVLHCCTEKWEDVASLIEQGYFLSFTGIATFPQAKEIRETIRQCPIEQIMIETDAPYLAPIPHRGKRNEPAFVIEVAKLVAQIKGLSLKEVDEITTRNTVEFFSLGK